MLLFITYKLLFTVSLIRLKPLYQIIINNEKDVVGFYKLVYYKGFKE